MNLKFILTTIFVISLCFIIFPSLYSDSNLVSSVEAQQSPISDHEFHGYLEQMNGHLDASIINVQSNNNVLAVAYVLHPIEEIIDIINNRLIETNGTLTKEFSSKLNQYTQTVKSDNLSKITLEKAELEKLVNDALTQSISLEKKELTVTIYSMLLQN